MSKTALFSIMSVTLFVSTVLASAGEEVASAGREILEKYQDAVVTVKLVIKEGMSFGGYGSHQYEEKSEAIGTVIDASGLTVLSLSSTDPTDFYSQIFSDEDGTGSLEMTSELSDVRIILPDGSELEARIVLRDRDLDMAFVRPLLPPEKPLTAVDLSDASEPKTLDEVLVLTRMGRLGDRTPRAMLTRVEAVVTKPRTFYVLGDNSSALGAPAFTLDGKLAGIVFYRRLERGGGLTVSSLLSGSESFGMLSTVLPCSEIVEVAEQAPHLEEEKSK